MIMRVIEWILIMCFGERQVDVSRYTTVSHIAIDMQKEESPLVQFAEKGFTFGERGEDDISLRYNAMIERRLADAALRERRTQYEAWRDNNKLLFAS